MLYSIQNSFGEVYGIYEMPNTGKSAEVIAAELGETLAPILGINGVRDVPFVRSEPPVREDRVVIDIDPSGQVNDKLIRVGQAIANLALREE
jgi:hypothetical protein